MKKKIIAAVCIVLCLGTAAGILIYRFSASRQSDIRETPLPAVIDTAEAFAAPKNYADVQFQTTLAREGEMDEVPLFGKKYHAIVSQSSETFTDADGMVYAEEKLIDYYGADDMLLYRSVIHRFLSNVYGADGTLLYSCTNYAPDVDFDAEPIRWFYKDGNPAAAELFFTDADSGNFGTAYYDGSGNLVCLYTEIFGTDDQGAPANQRTYYNAAYETMDESAFLALLPEMDAPQFLYINWS